MASLVRAWPIAASALLMLAAFPPFNLGLLVFVALVPWVISLQKATGWGSVRSGFLFGILYMLGQMTWLQPLTVRWTGSDALSLLPLVLAPLVTAPFFAILGWLMRECWRREWPWLIPVVWAGVEVLRSYTPGLAFPWGLASTPLYPYPILIQWAAIGSVFLVSSFVLLANVLVALLVMGKGFMAVRSYGIALVVMIAFTVLRYSNPLPGTKTPITIGQLGIDLAFGNKDEIRQRLGPTIELFRGAALANKSKLLVLPEGLIKAGDAMPPPVPFGVQGNVNLIFGGQRGTGPYYQSAFAYDGEWKVVDKTRLVVFGEYVPAREYLPFLDAFRLPAGDLSPGEKVSAVKVGDLEVGPLLCFEALFPDVALAQARKGAQILAVMALDDWYFGTQAPEQLMSASVFRAVETGLPVVRSAPLGYSVAIESNGDIVAQAPLGQSQPMNVELTVPAAANPFPTAGYYRILAPAICFALALAAVVRREQKKQAE